MWCNGYNGDFQKDHRSASGHRFSKATDDTRRHGKFVSSIHSHSDCIDSVPPTAVTPSKEDRPLSRTKVTSRSSTKRDISSKGSRRTQRDNVIHSRKSATSVSDPPLSCIAINWLSPTVVCAELQKHLSDDQSVPMSTCYPVHSLLILSLRGSSPTTKQVSSTRNRSSAIQFYCPASGWIDNIWRCGFDKQA